MTVCGQAGGRQARQHGGAECVQSLVQWRAREWPRRRQAAFAGKLIATLDAVRAAADRMGLRATPTPDLCASADKRVLGRTPKWLTNQGWLPLKYANPKERFKMSTKQDRAVV